MGKLKLVKTLKDEYTVEVISRRYGQSTHQSSYHEKDVESDDLTNLLAYAIDHKWDLESDREDCKKTLTERLKEEIFNDVELSKESEARIKENVNYLLSDLFWHLEGYLVSIKITKGNDLYNLAVCKEDIRKIFLS